MNKTRLLLFLTATILIILILFIPLEILEFLSLQVVGEPPINGLTWLEGVYSLGGELSMRILAIFGVSIIFLAIPFILTWEKNQLKNRDVNNKEIAFFFTTTLLFFIVNLLIGYNWWDPNGFLGMGPLFVHSIISLVILGIIPEISKIIFKFKREDFAESTSKFKEFSALMILAAFGYGLISLIWHCCSFFDVKMYFFFFVIKFIQLWAMTSFFFKWGFKLFLNKMKEWQAFLIISVLFGFCYPWHTIGFAITFMLFGVILCYLTYKTDSYLPGLILLYFSYIFHAGLAWQGPIITFSIIYPISIILIGIVLIFNIKKEPLGNPS